MADGWDQSWGFADPATAKARGMVVVSGYLSNDGSKNLTVADVKAYHAVGIGVLFNWESDAGRPLLGAAAGKQDATTAVAQARALIAGSGVTPSGRVSIYFSCDRDTTAAQYAAIDAYYAATKAIVHAAGFGNGVYGEADLVAHLAAAGLTDSEWQTYAWSGGRLDPAADFYQYSNGQKLGGADVDLDRVIHPAQLGALWPAGHSVDSINIQPLEDELSAAEVAEIKKAISDLGGFIMGNAQKPDLTHPGQLVNIRNAVNALAGKVASSGTDPKAIAAAIVDALPPDLAKEVATEFADLVAKRLAP